MALSPEERRLRDQFFQQFMEAARTRQPGADPEVTLEALIDAAGMLQEHLQRELEALREEQAR